MAFCRYFDVGYVLRRAGAIGITWQRERVELAERTSPTNIGLQLISTLAAYDFGYLSAASVVARLEPTFGTLLKLQRDGSTFDMDRLWLRGGFPNTLTRITSI